MSRVSAASPRLLRRSALTSEIPDEVLSTTVIASPSRHLYNCCATFDMERTSMSTAVAQQLLEQLRRGPQQRDHELFDAIEQALEKKTQRCKLTKKDRELVDAADSLLAEIFRERGEKYLPADELQDVQDEGGRPILPFGSLEEGVARFQKASYQRGTVLRPTDEASTCYRGEKDHRGEKGSAYRSELTDVHPPPSKIEAILRLAHAERKRLGLRDEGIERPEREDAGS